MATVVNPPSVVKSDDYNLNVIQINLHNSAMALEGLVEFAARNSIDVALVQKPYVGVKFKLPSSIQVFNLSRKGSRSAILIFNSKIKGVLFGDLTNELVTVVKISTTSEMTVVSVYSPPGGTASASRSNLSAVLSQLDVLMGNEASQVLVSGDFNAKHSEWSARFNDPQGDLLLDWIMAKNLTLLNTNSIATFSCTRGDKLFESHIDVTVATSNLLPKVISWEVLDEESFSDHRYIKIQLGAPIKRITESTALFNIPSTRKLIYESALVKAVNRADAFLSQKCYTEEQLDSKAECLTRTICSAARTASIPMNPLRRFRDAWWTPQLEAQKQRIKRLLSKIRIAKTGNARLNLSIQIQVLKRLYRQAVKVEKRDHWRDICKSTKKDDYYSTLGKICKQSGRKMIGKFTIGGTSIDATMASVTQRILFHHFPSQNSWPLALGSLDLEHALPSLGRDELREVLESFSKKKSPGKDGVTSEMLAPSVMEGPLLSLFNDCIRLRYFPRSWKTAVVKVIPKPDKDDYTDPRSYRPIGLLSVVGKVFEKVISRRLMHDLHTRQAVCGAQFGFTPERSSVDALQLIVKKLKSAKKYGGGVLVSLDIKGAFDNLQWQLVLDALVNMGVDLNYVAILASYFSDRSAEIWENGDVVSKKITQGCVQGSVLGPLMWNCVLDSLLTDLKKHGVEVVSYADDVTLLFSALKGTDITLQVQRVLQHVLLWGDLHSLTFSPEKTNLMVLGNQGVIGDITFHDQPLIRKDTVKILGLVIDKNLNFEKHCSKVIEKAMSALRNVGRISGCCWGAGTDVLHLIYKTIIEKIITYAAPAWCMLVNSKGWSKLHQFQRRCLVKILKGYRTMSYYSSFLLSGEMDFKHEMTKMYEQYQLKFATATKWEYERNLSEWQLRPPPGRQSVPYESKYGKSSACEIYTDGSKIEESEVGAAYVVYLEGSEVASKEFKLYDDCSVFQAEVVAIREAVRFFEESGHATCSVISDSLSALQELSNRSSKKKMINEIQLAYTALVNKGRLLRFYWIKAHAGHAGNERADELAKRGTRVGSMVNVLPPKSWAVRCLKLKKFREWCVNSKTWIGGGSADSSQRTITKFFSSPVEVVALRRRITWTSELTWLLSGHGPMGQYLVRFRKSTSSKCWCNHPYQTTIHILFSCEEPKLKLARKAMMGDGLRWAEPSDVMIMSKKCPDKLEKLFLQAGDLLRLKCLPLGENNPFQVEVTPASCPQEESQL